MAHALSVVKTGRKSTADRSFAKAALSGNGLGCADDNSPNTQEFLHWALAQFNREETHCFLGAG